MIYRCKECTLLRVYTEGATCWECAPPQPNSLMLNTSAYGGNWYWQGSRVGDTLASSHAFTVDPLCLGYVAVPIATITITFMGFTTTMAMP